MGTPGAAKVFPSFATEGCDWGQATIFAPASSTTGPSFEPDLLDEFDAHKNITTFDLSAENPSPDSVPVNPAATTVTLWGTNLDTATKIGFFQGGANVPLEIPKARFDSQTATSITVTLPNDLPTLTTASGLWWVRLYAPERTRSDTTMKWLAIKSGSTLSTVPFEVGESYLRCAGVVAGSFGDVLLPRSQPAGITSANWLAMNIATNLQAGPPRLSLTTYPARPHDRGRREHRPQLLREVRRAHRVLLRTLRHRGGDQLRPQRHGVDGERGDRRSDRGRHDQRQLLSRSSGHRRTPPARRGCR